jgi:FG-GAP repeat
MGPGNVARLAGEPFTVRRRAVRFVRSGMVAMVTTAGLLAGIVSLAGPAAAANDCGISRPVSDFNGDGFADAVVGDPAATVNGQASAGKVTVLYGSASGLGLSSSRATLTEGFPHANDRYGAVVEAGYVDGDSCADLVVSAPDASPLLSAFDTGTVYVVYGSVNGLGAGKATLQITPDTVGFLFPQEGDKFGAALAISENSPSYQTGLHSLAIGVPETSVTGHAGAGAVAFVTFDSSGAVDSHRVVDQESTGVDGAAEDGDHFGAAVGLATGTCTVGGCDENLYIGAPREDLGGKADAGLVTEVFDVKKGPPYADNTLVQGSPGVAGTAEAGDRFGASLAVDFAIFDHEEFWQVAIGAPGEAIGSRGNAGAVVIYHGPFISQDSAGVAGAAEAGDHFGATLAFTPMNGEMQLAVGVPGEDLGTARDAGAVQTFKAAPHPGDSDHYLDQNSDGIAGSPQSGDHFGAALSAAGAWDQSQMLLIGTPDDAVFTKGVVHAISWQKILTGSGAAYTWAPGLGGVPSGALRFGASVAAASTTHDV